MHKVLIIFFLVFSTTNFFSQKENSSNGYFVIKANAGAFKDDETIRFNNCNPDFMRVENGLRCGSGKYIGLQQKLNKTFVFPGGEINYYLPRAKFFGLNIGLSYSYDKTLFNFYSSDRVSNVSNKFTEIRGEGIGSLNNHMLKLTFGFNFNSSGGFNFYFQPLNPELRFIRSGPSNITYSTYEGYYSSKVDYQHCSPPDSAVSLISTESKKFEYVNYKYSGNFSIAFPTLIGIEQKFKIKKITYLAGISYATSFLEGYTVFRFYFGVCFGNFKRLETQPGY